MIIYDIYTIPGILNNIIVDIINTYYTDSNYYIDFSDSEIQQYMLDNIISYINNTKLSSNIIIINSCIPTLNWRKGKINHTYNINLDIKYSISRFNNTILSILTTLYHKPNYYIIDFSTADFIDIRKLVISELGKTFVHAHQIKQEPIHDCNISLHTGDNTIPKALVTKINTWLKTNKLK